MMETMENFNNQSKDSIFLLGDRFYFKCNNCGLSPEETQDFKCQLHKKTISFSKRRLSFPSPWKDWATLRAFHTIFFQG